MNRIFAYILLFISHITLYSQVIVEQKISQVDILIGEQVELETIVLVDANQRVNYPIFATQNYMDGVEVVSEGKIDTTLLNSGKRMQLARTYKLTSFDSAFYRLPPFYVVVENDTFIAPTTIGLKVTSIPVDTVNANNFAGPYTVTTIPFEWNLTYWLLILLIPLLVYIVILLYKRIKRNTPITKRIVIAPPTPAHQEALAQFATVTPQHLDSEDKLKVYYDQITNILRQYIENRFNLNAKELTSDEIISKLTASNNAVALRELKEILSTADLVKFAKYKASMSEANRSVAMALDYVNSTRLSDDQLPKPEVKIVTISQNKQRTIRIALIVLMSILGLTAIYIVGYILTDIYMCFIA